MNRMHRHTSIIVCLFSICLLGLSSIDYSEREERIKAMNAVELEELRNKLRRFELLSPEDRQRVETIHDQLQSHDNREELQRVMEAYYKWLLTLDESERRSIQTAASQDRIELVKQIRREKQYELFKITEDSSLSQDDIEKLFDWTNRFAVTHRNEVVAALEAIEDNKDVRDYLEQRQRWMRGWMRNWIRNNSRRDPDEQELRDEASKRIAPFVMLQLNQHNQVAITELITDEDIQDLRSQFSEKARAELESSEFIEDQRDMVRGWMIRVIKVKNEPNRYDYSQEEMHKFYNEQLTPEERAYLDKLGQEEFTRELREKMRRFIRSRERDGSRPD